MESCNYLTPLYDSNISYRESLFFIVDEDSIASAKLLHECENVIKMENLSGNCVWEENVDFIIKDNKIILTSKSSIPKFEKNFSNLEEPYSPEKFKNVDGGYLYFETSGKMQLDQVFITYQFKKRTPIFCPNKSTRLNNFNKLIDKGADIAMLIYGDSISTGCDSSGSVGLEPYMPNWANQIKELIQNNSDSHINLINTSVGGTSTPWGIENFQENVLDHNPDLLIIGFGMNDGTGRIEHKEFYNNIKMMIDKTESNIDIILISTMLPNPKAATNTEIPFLGYQKEYRPYLKSLTCERVELFDMTAIHEDLLNYKKVEDLLGNNINHPNDYLSRWYAQGIFKLMGIK